jgi:3-hydroxy-9,10-secoandrosta-1,3,5(10)-triene-9,17-dione monooxygenase
MTPETYLARVRALLPALRERAVPAEKLRRVPDETIADFQEAGLFRCLQPKRYGGFELDPATLYQAVIEVGAVCGSTGWILGVIGIHNWHLALFPPQAQDDIWGKDTSIQVSTSLAPTGTVTRVDGGFRLQGRWPFSSGCDFCHWAALGGVVPPLEDGAPPDVRTFLVPRSDYTIDDTWYAVGLCATGSKDVVVDDAFVPEYRTHSYRDAFYLTNPGAVVNDGPLYRLPFGLVFPACISSPAIGVALGALAAFREQTITRISPRDKSRVAEDPFVQFSLAEAAAEVTAARDRLLGNFGEAMRTVCEGGELSLAQRARYRWDTAKAADRSVRAVDRLFEASGGRGIFLDNPIQRAWRDVHAIRAHAGNNLERAAFVFGRSELGLPPVDLRF